MMLEDGSYCSRGEGVLSPIRRESISSREGEGGFPDESIHLFSALPATIRFPRSLKGLRLRSR